MKKCNKHIGSALDAFLTEEGILEEARATAAKEALEWRAAGRQRFEAAYAPKDSVYEEDDVAPLNSPQRRAHLSYSR